MSDTINNAKQLIADGKFPFIIDTMAEFDDFSLGKELGVGKFGLFHVRTYETCKQILASLLKNTPKDKLDECAVVISNIKVLAGERYLEISQMSDQPTVEVEIQSDTPDEPSEKATVPEISREALIQHRLLKQLLLEIKSAREAGLDIVIVEGGDDEWNKARNAFVRMWLDGTGTTCRP